LPSFQQTNIREGTVQIRQGSKTPLAPRFNRLAISLAGATLIAAGVLASPLVHAQGASQVSSLNMQTPYNDQTLQSFAVAASTVLALRNTYFPRIRAAEIAGSNDRADLLFKEMRGHMNTAINSSGFTTDQYRAISTAAKTDAVLRHRINAIIQGPSPAQQHIQKVKRVQPQAPQVATAPSTAAPATANAVPATPPVIAAPQTAVVTAPTAAPADDGAQQRLEAELSKTNAERDRYLAQQLALQEKVRKLESQLSNVKAQDSALREQLNAKKAQAQAAQKKSKAELETLQREVTTLKDELTDAQSQDSSLRELLEAERQRADAEKTNKEAKLAAFRGEIKRLAESLATAQQALDSLAGDLKPGEVRQTTPAFEALQPLRREPNSIDRVLEKTQPGHEKRQELNGEIARIQKERAHREAERNALQQEIAVLSRDLTATYQAMAELIGEPVNITVAAAEPDTLNDTYTLALSQETALLFEGIPEQFGQALADPQADILLNQPIALDASGSGDEPSPGQPAASTALEPADIAPLRVNNPPTVQIATATAPAEPEIPAASAAQPPHQIVRDDVEFKPAIEPAIEPVVTATAAPDTNIAGGSPNYRNSVGGGAAAYKAADYDRAYEIWAPLAQSGNRSAQFHLGALYFEGRGTGVDFRQAYFWLRLAARRGDERAAPLIPEVAEKLTLDDIRATEAQTQQWLDQHAVKVTRSGSTDKNRL
jgi:predicted  nucleic acid-binding Zn-ribbon protein